MFEKWLLESLEDIDRYPDPGPWRELAIPWRVLLYAAFRPAVWSHTRAVMARWSADLGARYINIMLWALAYLCAVGLAACVIGFFILIF